MSDVVDISHAASEDSPESAVAVDAASSEGAPGDAADSHLPAGAADEQLGRSRSNGRIIESIDLSKVRAYSEELEGWPRLCLTHSTSWTLHPLYSKEELCESGSLRVSIVKSSKEGPKTTPHTEYVIVIKTAFSVRSICRRTADFARLDAALRPSYPAVRQLPVKRLIYSAIPNLFLNEAKIAADRLKQMQFYLDDVMARVAAAWPPALIHFLGCDKFAEEMRALGRQPRASSCRQRGVWRPEDAGAQLEHALVQLSNLQQLCGSSPAEDPSQDRHSPLSDTGENDSGGAASAAETTAISVVCDSSKLQLAASMHRVALLRVMVSLCPPAKLHDIQSHLGDGSSHFSSPATSPHTQNLNRSRVSSPAFPAPVSSSSPLLVRSPPSVSASMHLSPIASTSPLIHSPASVTDAPSPPKDKADGWSLQLQESSKLLSQAASICMAFGDAHGALAATSNLSVVLLLDGRAEQALELCDRCIEAATKLGEVCCLVLVLTNAAYMYLSTGARESAVDAACAAMEGARDSSESDIFRAFEAGMHIYLAVRDYAQLFTVGEQALLMLRPTKDVFGLAAIMYALGCSFALQSYHAHAKDYFDQAAAQCRAVGDVQGLVLCLMGSGASCSELGENEKGLQVRALDSILFPTPHCL
jgi:hypothetical protein